MSADTEQTLFSQLAALCGEAEHLHAQRRYAEAAACYRRACVLIPRHHSWNGTSYLLVALAESYRNALHRG